MMKITKSLKIGAYVGTLVVLLALSVAVFVLPAIGESKHQLDYVARSDTVRKAMDSVAASLMATGAATPSVQLGKGDGVVAELFVSSDGKVIVLGRSGWLGFIAIPKVTPSGVTWKCQSILGKLPWTVRCG